MHRRLEFFCSAIVVVFTLSPSISLSHSQSHSQSQSLSLSQSLLGVHASAQMTLKKGKLNKPIRGTRSNRAPASVVNSIWKMSTDAAVLKQTFQPMAGENMTKSLYTCEGVAGASQTDGPGAVMPRVVLRGPNRAVVWICATDHGTKATASVVHVQGNVTVFFKVGDKAPQRLLAQTGELAHPVDVEVTESDLRIIDNYVIRHGAKIASWRPMTRVTVSCDTSNCNAAPPKCVLALQKKDDRQIVARFDRAVQKYKVSPGKNVMELSEPFQLLDEVLLAAASGDKKAADRLQNFPIQPEGPAIELVGSYADQLDHLRSLKCFAETKEHN